ncbi:MAG: pyridoxamine 5'-phosphate oxidase family protein [Candidatus Omnitrophota bacterium]|nr:pyridoxamine 5'-phosphate oxidase family protein [Candidatus Omnitrophota bacterium]
MLSEEIVHFFERQSFTIVSTIDTQGRIHNACKGLVSIDSSGRVYLLDLYHGKTYANLKNNPCMSLTGVDEHRFRGYCLKGRARILNTEELSGKVIAAWEEKLISRITQRVIDSIQGRKGHGRHPEVLLPNPKYLIAMDVDEVVDLTPAHISQQDKG